MVAALRECWRVLSPGGLLLDLRPIAGAFPVERITPDGVTRIGAIDGSRGLPEDLASDRALAIVVSERRFVHEQTMRFDLYSLWESVGELADHLARSTQRRRPPTQYELRSWSAACAGVHRVSLRTRERIQLGVYMRCGIGRSPGPPCATGFGCTDGH